MTKEELQNNYPKTWVSFSDWFRSEGWGASGASDLSEHGFDTWFSDFLIEYGILDVDSYEKHASG